MLKYDQQYLKSSKQRNLTILFILVVLLIIFLKTKTDKYKLDHLNQNSQYVYGPIQDDEALFVYSIIKVLRPKLVIETGMGHGYSSQNILKALDSTSMLFTYDIEILNKNAASFNDPRFKFIQKSQADFDPNDIDNKQIDLLYLDDGHFFDVNIKFWKKVIPFLAPNAVIINHDTGLHVNEREEYTRDKDCVCEFNLNCGWSHCPPERQFINWLIDNYPEWKIINLHSFNVFRHGLTIFQKGYKLAMTPTNKTMCVIL